ncbi:hypothetical protein GCM10020229_03350 [Kitasatospora albolonga]
MVEVLADGAVGLGPVGVGEHPGDQRGVVGVGHERRAHVPHDHPRPRAVAWCRAQHLEETMNGFVLDTAVLLPY